MSIPIIATKIYRPALRPQAVHRTRLTARLDDGLHRTLSLISAPAGFGKTTLISDWSAECGRPVAWLGLDADDGNVIRFVTYLVAALQSVAPQVGARVLAALNAPQSAPMDALLVLLLNDIAGLEAPLLLVLDDYHVVDSPAVDRILAFLLEHMPPQLHLVITTREDPPLPLARYRARDQLTEVRAADLRFTPAEAAQFLNRVMGLTLAPADIAALERRTEGWIAGLQLAALSMQGREDLAGFVHAFAGDNRYIVDYLADEVLQRQPESTRRFLLQTAILEQLTGGLCDAVTGEEASSARLDALERANLFVVPLDDTRRWFRYHRLFADVLLAHSLEEQPDQIGILHGRASRWYAENGLPDAAIRHALAASDFTHAADLIQAAWPAMDRSRQYTTWLGWARQLPDAMIRARPGLSIGYAWALLDTGNLEGAADRLHDVARGLHTTSPSADAATPHALAASAATARTYLAQARGDVAGTMANARLALQWLPEDDHSRRAVPASLLGLAHWTQGDLTAADDTLADALNRFERSGNALYAITGTFVLADIRKARGHLNGAFNLCQHFLELAEERGDALRWATADLHTALSDLHREWNDLTAAAACLQTSKELGDQAVLPRWQTRWCLAQARLKLARQDLTGAQQMLDEAERSYVRGPVPDVRPIAAWKARVLLAQGRLTEARSWVRAQNLSADDELSYLREFEHITLARVLLAEFLRDGTQQTIHTLLELLARLLQAAEEGKRTGSVIEILLLQALAQAAHGDKTGARAPLTRALALAEPEGYVRTFVDEGPVMAHLLADAAAQGLSPAYVATLRAAFAADSAPPRDAPAEQGTASTPAPVVPHQTSLVEPLSQRELEILQLIARGLTNREICTRLFLALSTVKGHNRNIYAKLQVSRRTEAVARARALGLLPN